MLHYCNEQSVCPVRNHASRFSWLPGDHQLIEAVDSGVRQVADDPAYVVTRGITDMTVS